ncbi:MFS transporter [Dactylosporangium sp. AC04546]|uniref:MFS transporter n=1 Tax=Dactylosporangium sp. AC04546 TaxID=2862460 RepID=UPI001EDD2F93|nr:MFS transporter [Dactylosporangium sp. AC04546]WVK79531.1 MFS transporter [Dactylosporangium sp. AC04546]
MTTGGSPFRRVFASLGSRNYRLYFAGQLVSQAGNWMQTVAQSFLVLELTDSGTQLGLTIAARYLPTFLLGPWGGLFADRFNKRTVLTVTQVSLAILALLFSVLIATDTITIAAVYVLATAFGVANVFDVPARQSLIGELVDRDDMANAVALNSTTVNSARVFGAALGGVAASALGLAVCFGLNAVSFVVVLLCLLLMDPARMHATERAARERGQIRASFRYVGRTPQLLVPLLMVGIVGALAWEFQVTLPLMARDVFGGGAGMYGAMMAVMSAGAVLGGLLTAARRSVTTRSLAVAAMWWGVALTAAAVAPNLALEWVALVFVGYGSVAFNALGRTILQLSARPDMRGRVMALWMIAWAGTTPIGGPIVGWVGEQFGARYSLLAGGLPTLAVGIVAYPVLSAIDARRRETEANGGHHEDQPRNTVDQQPGLRARPADAGRPVDER